MRAVHKVREDCGTGCRTLARSQPLAPRLACERESAAPVCQYNRGSAHAHSSPS
jgi:hypothetical protein